MKLYILSLFPDYFKSALVESMIKRAQEQARVAITVINIRDFATDKHKVTDDRPFGGGAGMVLKVDPIDRALESIKKDIPPDQSVLIVLTSAKGKLYTQAMAEEYAQYDVLIIICGHYEGVDERVAQYLVDHEVRIGNYVLTGGEPAALVLLDSVIRLLPGVLGNEASTEGESHSAPGLLGYPQYTRPQSYRGWSVPEVLVTGDHKKIIEWREKHRTTE
jgi:tRNA (guanine37-N1)-methyltransferase